MRTPLKRIVGRLWSRWSLFFAITCIVCGKVLLTAEERRRSACCDEHAQDAADMQCM